MSASLSKWRKRETMAFCRQLEELRREAACLLLAQTTSRDPTADIALRRAAIVRDIEIIEGTAQEIDGGRWARALILNACYGVRYDSLDLVDLPTCNRNAYFRARRLYFLRIAEKRRG